MVEIDECLLEGLVYVCKQTGTTESGKFHERRITGLQRTCQPGRGSS